MKKKKILFHINSLGKGGAERVVSVLARYFARDGYEVVIVTLWRAKEEYELPKAVKRMDLGDLGAGRKGGRRLLALRRFMDLRSVIRRERPGVVISFCVKANFRSAYAMLGMNTPLVVSVRNDPKIDYEPHRMATRWMERKARGCVFQTEEARAFFDPEFQKKSCVIFNPVDEKYLAAGKNLAAGKSLAAGENLAAGRSFVAGKGIGEEKNLAAEQEGMGGFQRRNRIVTVGRISRQKNQMLLLQAFHRIKDRFPGIVLQIYGEEGESGVKEELSAYIAHYKLEGRVFFMGQCSSLERELADAALFVLPSDYEGMPNALIEAMVLGLPVIATDCPCGGAAMLIEDGISGFLTPVGNEKRLAEAMARLLTDKKLAKSMAENARKLADKVRPEGIFEAWKEYVEAL